MWPRHAQLAILLTAAALAATPAAAAPNRDAEVLALGQSLVVRNCGLCHAVGRADVSPRPPAPAFRDLAQRYPIEALGESLAEGLLTGHPEMPEFRFEPHEVNAILRYLESIQARAQGWLAPSRTVGNVRSSGWRPQPGALDGPAEMASRRRLEGRSAQSVR